MKHCIFTSILIILLISAANNQSFGIYTELLQDKTLEVANSSQNEEYTINKDGNCIKLEKEVIKLINKERKRYNKEHSTSLKQLKLRTKLKKSARLRSKEMFDNDYFSHTIPDSSLWDTVFDEDEINITNKRRWAENIQRGYTYYMPTPQLVFSKFKASKPHYKNMLGDFDYIGVGFYCQKKDGYYVWFVTQHFLTYMPKSSSGAGNMLSTEKQNIITVYITPNGKKYHYSLNCASKNAKSITITEAKEQGYTPCERCAD